MQQEESEIERRGFLRRSGTSSGVRISLQRLFILISLVAMLVAVIAQSIRLTEVRRALARYESTQLPTTLESGQFRIIMNVVLDTGNMKVVKYRIECQDAFYASLEDEQGDRNASSSDFDGQSSLQFVEAIVAIDHLATEQRVKLLPKVGGAQGYSIMQVDENYSLGEEMQFYDVTGVHQRGEPLEIFVSGGNKYWLKVSP